MYQSSRSEDIGRLLLELVPEDVFARLSRNFSTFIAIESKFYILCRTYSKSVQGIEKFRFLEIEPRSIKIENLYILY